MEDGDTAGPFVLALAVEKTIGEETSQLIISGSTELFTDGADQIVSGNNLLLFTDILAGIVDNEDLTFSVIPVKEYSLGMLTITSAAVFYVGIAGMAVIPLLLLVTGIVIWARRRKR